MSTLRPQTPEEMQTDLPSDFRFDYHMVCTRCDYKFSGGSASGKPPDQCHECFGMDGKPLPIKKCERCGNKFGEPSSKPAFCRGCYYDHYGPKGELESVKALADAFHKLGVVLDIWHTGGGCWNPCFKIDEKRYILFNMTADYWTKDDEGEPDRAGFGLYTENEAGDDEDCEQFDAPPHIKYCDRDAEKFAAWAVPLIRGFQC